MNKERNILSLFDGLSCCRIALERAGVKVDKYYASEIDKNAIKITQHNYPDTIQLGDVTKVKTEKLDNIFLLAGGSPCQSFSFSGKRNGMSTLDNQEILTLSHYLDLKSKDYIFNGQSYLFWEYVRILNETKPQYFFLENVGMEKRWQDVISKTLNVEPIILNSNSISCQNRKRLYWTNIDVTPLLGKDLFFKNIIDEDSSKYEFWSEGRMKKFHNKEYVRKDTYRVLELDDKIPCLTVRAGHGGSDEPKVMYNDVLRRLTPLEWERAQTLPDNYTDILKSNNIRRGIIGNGWTVDVIAHIFEGLKE